MVVENVAKFVFGFVIGMIIEWVIIYVYNQVDPREESNVKLITLVVIQLFILFALMEKFSIIDDVYSRVGILSSQVFVFNYALKRLYPFKNYMKHF
jgi:NhaP-type Na+/H+ or K+/H+ antiporter